MHSERLLFIVGHDVDIDEWEDATTDDHADLLNTTWTDDPPALSQAGRSAVAHQMWSDEPPETWATAQRLTALGLDRQEVFEQIASLIEPQIMAAIRSQATFDMPAFVEQLASLPLPDAADIETLVIRWMAERVVVVSDEFDAEVAAHFDRSPDDAGFNRRYDIVLDSLVDQLGPFEYLTGDRMCDVSALTTGIVLTHRWNEFEQQLDVITASFDLAGFERRDGLRLPDGQPIDVFSADRGHLAWKASPGWLDHLTAGALVAVRIDDDGCVDLQLLLDEPPLDPRLVASLRTTYDRIVESTPLPVSGEDLILEMLADDPAIFAHPQRPLAELAEAAGLIREVDEVVADPQLFYNGLRLRRMHHLFALTGKPDDHERFSDAMFVLGLADAYAGIDPAWISDFESDTPTPSDLCGALASMDDPHVLSLVISELFDSDDGWGEEWPLREERFTDALVAAARRPRERAIALFLAGMVAERRPDVLAAEQHVRAAHQADPSFAVATDRWAWCAYDRGDAATARRLWSRLEDTDVISRDLAAIPPFGAALKIGRNEPCWCGSGRKFKQCHLGAAELPSLDDRLTWLVRKPVAYVERRGAGPMSMFIDLAQELAGGRHNPDVEVDPLVMDLVLHEGGWLRHYLTERGALLPDDEALLAQSWTHVDRTVYKVLAAEPGAGLTLRDLRTLDQLDVSERSLSRVMAPPDLFAGRAVPTPSGHMLLGGWFPVRPGHEATVLDLLDAGDPYEIIDWVRRLRMPPTLSTREGEPLVEVEVVVDAGDPVAARAALDSLYESTEEAGLWQELHALPNGDSILRCRFVLADATIAIATTSSERADRALAALRSEIPGLTIVSDERKPIDADRFADFAGRFAPDGAVPLDPAAITPELHDAMEEIRDTLERRWCDELVPALGDITPRQAADDPTRREGLIRLIGSFERFAAAPDSLTMRPDRLRTLLGLDAAR